MFSGFTSIFNSLDRLLEAEYFLVRSSGADLSEFQFEFNAFLSASRSVTFMLQSDLSKARGFQEWYSDRQAGMKQDTAMKYLLELRNISQKAGPVPVTTSGSTRGGVHRRFVHGKHPVPEENINKKV